MKKLLVILILLIAAHTQAATLMPSARVQYVDANGDPYAGALLYTYTTGTTTPKTTWQDEGEASANDNPIELDTKGMCTLFGSGVYRLVLKSADNVTTIFTEDNVSSLVESLATDDIFLEEHSATGTHDWFVVDHTAAGAHKDTIVNNAGYFSRGGYEYKDADEIYINAAVWHHSGTSDQLVFWDEKLTFQFGPGGSNADSSALANDTEYYLYIDDSAIVTLGDNELTASEFIAKTTAPTWSETKHGWYSGSDRCLFWVKTGSITTDINEFYVYGDTCFFDYDNTELSATDIDSTWTDVTIDDLPAFSTMPILKILTAYVDTDTNSQWRTNGSSATFGHYVGYISADTVESIVITTVITDSDGKIEVRMGNAGDDTIAIGSQGWKFGKGI